MSSSFGPTTAITNNNNNSDKPKFSSVVAGDANIPSCLKSSVEGPKSPIDGPESPLDCSKSPLNSPLPDQDGGAQDDASSLRWALTLTSRIPFDEDGKLTSIGSIFHHQGTCKPCRFHHHPGKPEGCQYGVGCLFCHFHHERRRRRAVTERSGGPSASTSTNNNNSVGMTRSSQSTSPLNNPRIPNSNHTADAIGQSTTARNDVMANSANNRAVHDKNLNRQGHHTSGPPPPPPPSYSSNHMALSVGSPPFQHHTHRRAQPCGGGDQSFPLRSSTHNVPPPQPPLLHQSNPAGRPMVPPPPSSKPPSSYRMGATTPHSPPNLNCMSPMSPPSSIHQRFPGVDSSVAASRFPHLNSGALSGLSSRHTTNNHLSHAHCNPTQQLLPSYPNNGASGMPGISYSAAATALQDGRSPPSLLADFNRTQSFPRNGGPLSPTNGQVNGWFGSGDKGFTRMAGSRSPLSPDLTMSSSLSPASSIMGLSTTTGGISCTSPLSLAEAHAVLATTTSAEEKDGEFSPKMMKESNKSNRLVGRGIAHRTLQYNAPLSADASVPSYPSPVVDNSSSSAKSTNALFGSLTACSPLSKESVGKDTPSTSYPMSYEDVTPLSSTSHGVFNTPPSDISASAAAPSEVFGSLPPMTLPPLSTEVAATLMRSGVTDAEFLRALIAPLFPAAASGGAAPHVDGGHVGGEWPLPSGTSPAEASCETWNSFLSSSSGSDTQRHRLSDQSFLENDENVQRFANESTAGDDLSSISPSDTMPLRRLLPGPFVKEQIQRNRSGVVVPPFSKLEVDSIHGELNKTATNRVSHKNSDPSNVHSSSANVSPPPGDLSSRRHSGIDYLFPQIIV